MFTDTFIREVRVSYQKSDINRFAIRGPEDVAVFVRGILTDNSREHFVALYLNGAHEVSSYSVVTIGLANKSLVHPREVFQRAVLSGAVSVVLSHNHPSGSTKPSNEDRETTKALVDAGRVLGIPVLDHVIVTDDSYLSMKEEGSVF